MDLWLDLLPLVVGGAVVPIQLVLTILLLGSSAGRGTAVAFVAGMTSVRLLQGLLFAVALGSGPIEPDASGPGPVVATVLLVVGILLLATAARQALAAEDPDAPPPRWTAMTGSMGAPMAFLMGAGVLVLGVKLWVLTLGALGTIVEADLGRGASIGTFLVFVVLTESLHLVVLGLAFALPTRSAALLGSATRWLEAHDRVIVIVLGVVFGTWFLLKGLTGLDVL